MTSFPNLQKAIAFCDGITLSFSEECYSGIFMENMTRQNLSEHGLVNQFNWTKESVRVYEELCRTFKGKAASGCWGEMGHMYAAVYHDEAMTVYNLCKTAPSEAFTQNCYFHAVEKISVTNNIQLTINSLCKPYANDKELFESCISRVINALLTISSKFFDRANEFCSDIVNDYQQACFTNLAQKLSEKVSKLEQDSLCKKLPAKFKDICSTHG